jgi:hypothetical protein
MRVEWWSDPYTDRYYWLLDGWFLTVISFYDVISREIEFVEQNLRDAILHVAYLRMPVHDEPG